MTNINKIRTRKNIRLYGYDYSQEGLYFITICVQNRRCLFGNIANGEMILNDAGTMVAHWYYELAQKYPDKKCHEMVVMPNHFHCIIENKNIDDDCDAYHERDGDHERDTLVFNERDAHVGAPLRGRPQMTDGHHGKTNAYSTKTDHNTYGLHNKKYNSPIGDAINWFKTMTTNAYIHGVNQYDWERFDGKLWQRNYYDHIIRNPESYERISEYIRTNPIHWETDTLKL